MLNLFRAPCTDPINSGLDDNVQPIIGELPQSLRDVYCNIFKRVNLAKSGISKKARNNTDWGYLRSNIIERLGNKGTYDPYSLREANFKFSVNRYWRECEYQVDENGEIEEGLEINDWNNCVNRFVGFSFDCFFKLPGLEHTWRIG